MNIPSTLFLKLWCLLALLTSQLPVVHAADAKATWTLEPAALQGQPGETVVLKVHAQIPAGWHIYSLKKYADGPAPTELELSGTGATLSGAITQTKPSEKFDEGFQIKVEIFEKEATFTLPLKIGPEAHAGTTTLELLVRHQMCDAKQCLPPTEVKLVLPLTVQAGVAPDHAKVEKQEKVTWKLEPEKLEGQRGETVTLKIRATMQPGFHIYSLKKYELGPQPTEFTIKSPLVELGTPGQSTPHVMHDPGFDVDVEVYEHTAEFTLPLKIAAQAPFGTGPLELEISSQVCNDKSCNPGNARLPFKLTVLEGAASVEVPPKTAPSPALPGSKNEASTTPQNTGFWSYILIAAAAGGTALLTPCVFPMIPITVSFFTKRKQVSRAKSMRDAVIFSGSIIAAFTLIGFLCAIFWKASGVQDLAANPFVNLAVAGLFTVLALNLFGAFELQVPSWILTKLDAKANEGEGLLSVFFMGLVFALTSFTCTGPFVGTALAAAANGAWFYPAAGLFAFSLVFSLPFFILALFPALLKSLPKAGGWLNSVKVVMGFLELAAALKFISQADVVWHWGLVSREVFLAVWTALMALTCGYLLGLYRFAHDKPLEYVSGTRILFTTFFGGLAFWFGQGLFSGNQLGLLEAYLPPYSQNESSSAGKSVKEELHWYTDYHEALAESKKTGKPLFMDFTGYTCTNCRLMEVRMFTKPEITARLKNVVRVKLYTDGRGAEAEKSKKYSEMQTARWQTSALPFYVIQAPDEKTIATFPGLTYNVEEFTAFLDKAKN